MKCSAGADNAASSTSTVVKMEELVAGEQLHTFGLKQGMVRCKTTTFTSPVMLNCPPLKDLDEAAEACNNERNIPLMDNCANVSKKTKNKSFFEMAKPQGAVEGRLYWEFYTICFI